MNTVISLAVLSLILADSAFAAAPGAATAATEAPAGFDNGSNGITDEATHQADLAKFDEVEQIANGPDRYSTRSPAANATRIRFPGARAKYPSCASAIWIAMGTSKIPRFRLHAASRSLPAAHSSTTVPSVPTRVFPARRSRSASPTPRPSVPFACP